MNIFEELAKVFSEMNREHPDLVRGEEETPESLLRGLDDVASGRVSRRDDYLDDADERIGQHE